MNYILGKIKLQALTAFFLCNSPINAKDIFAKTSNTDIG
jgi:hypothetical protein